MNDRDHLLLIEHLLADPMTTTCEALLDAGLRPERVPTTPPPQPAPDERQPHPALAGW